LDGEGMKALTRRELLAALAVGPVAGWRKGLTGADASAGFPMLTGQNDAGEAGSPRLALRFARLLNAMTFGDLPPQAVDHAKMIIASTIASAASGSLIGSGRIGCRGVREVWGGAEV